MLDCYKQATTDNPPEKPDSISLHFLDYCLFITFFPQLIAGPIVHHKEMMPQFDAMDTIQIRKQNSLISLINWEYMAKGLFIFAIGLFKKVVIADSFAKWANAGFSAVENGAVLNLFESWATSLSYTFQLYFDFSGYCDMALGLGLLFGILLPLNFNSPYKALNITDFWRRWHITLGRFFREYVYIPLGGNRNEKYKNALHYIFLNKILTLRNLFIVALLSGIWHGAGWGFVIWGILHGGAMVVHRIYLFVLEYLQKTDCTSCSHFLVDFLLRFIQQRIYKILCWIITFSFVNIAWVFFRAQSLDGALTILRGMFYGEVVLPSALQEKIGKLEGFDDWVNLLREPSLIVWGFILCAFVVCLCFKNSLQYTNTFIPNFKTLFVVLSLLFGSMIGYSYRSSAEFLYFNF
ncbi:MBOAT family O-acyltransferase [Helicobacter sp. 10-6591]|uniref:MBOAT family O-acyltransferase n=1 Tax=Helicobacter sp. 10-6591 TaxID=2004998 RepID=UPI0023EEAC10|nr:MBOAT family O-acyltransferase [Helicobacter sp. 10-6591]